MTALTEPDGVTLAALHGVRARLDAVGEADVGVVIAPHRLVAPVVCGDTIHAEVTTESARESASRPGHGVLTLRHRVVNQDGVEVMTYKTTRLMELRPE